MLGGPIQGWQASNATVRTFRNHHTERRETENTDCKTGRAWKPVPTFWSASNHRQSTCPHYTLFVPTASFLLLHFWAAREAAGFAEGVGVHEVATHHHGPRVAEIADAL